MPLSGLKSSFGKKKKKSSLLNSPKQKQRSTIGGGTKTRSSVQPGSPSARNSTAPKPPSPPQPIFKTEDIGDLKLPGHLRGASSSIMHFAPPEYENSSSPSHNTQRRSTKPAATSSVPLAYASQINNGSSGSKRGSEGGNDKSRGSKPDTLLI